MEDRRGNPVGTRSPAALDHAETALWRMVSFFDAPIADLEAASAEDPGWMLPHVMRAGFLLSLTEPSLVADASAALDTADALAGAATDRERAHLAAARRCAAGDWRGACAAWDDILRRHPRDLAALQSAHLFDFYLGDAAALRARPERVRPAWSVDDALRPYLLGMHAFGLEESHAYAEAEAVGREAVSGPARVPWATHAVAHVMEMQGRFDEGLAWLAARQADWSEGNGFAGHHWWHRALFHLEAMDLAGALDLYDRELDSRHSTMTLQRLDGAALLWRLHLLGADVGARWDDVAIGWDLSPEGAGHSVFNDLHALLVRLGQRRFAEAACLVEAVERRAAAGRGGQATIAREVGVPLMRGLLALGSGDAAEALRLIGPVRTAAWRFGGSHAQRDLVAQTLLAAAAQAGDRSAGQALLDERRRAKPHTPLTAHWAAQLLA
jgi:hypothetical protein